MKISRVLFVLLFAAACGSGAKGTVGPDGIRRLAPENVSALPGAIRSALESRGCTVPQTGSSKTENVIRGRFMESGEQWAILCSRSGETLITVFSDERATRVWELGLQTDRDFVAQNGGGSSGVARVIRVVDAKGIRSSKALQGRMPPPLTHDGIADGAAGQSPDIHYYGLPLGWTTWRAKD